MPYRTEWVEPELMIEHEGKKIFYAYRHDDAEERMSYWYNTDREELDGEFGGFRFDIRELPNYDDKRHHLEILAEAIDKGFVKFPEPLTDKHTVW